MDSRRSTIEIEQTSDISISYRKIIQELCIFLLRSRTALWPDCGALKKSLSYSDACLPVAPALSVTTNSGY